MYTHSYQIFDHTWFSETRLFMTLIMGGSKMIIMLPEWIKLSIYTIKPIKEKYVNDVNAPITV